MTYTDLIKHYGSEAAAARAVGYDRQRVFGWRNLKRVPTDPQIAFEIESKGALRADIPKKIRQS